MTGFNFHPRFNRRDFTQFVTVKAAISRDFTRTVDVDTFDRLFDQGALKVDADGHGGTEEEGGGVTCELTDAALAFACRLTS
jgi:hypothetical protein